MIIAIYARVSTGRQEKEETINSQIDALQEAAKKAGHTIVQIYKDEGWSGAILARPALDRLRDDSMKRIWQAVMVYDRDRLARKLAYQELIIEELLENNIEIIFLNEPLAKDAEGRVLQQIKGVFSEYERIKTAERMRRGKMYKAKQGYVVTGQAPYGYKYIQKQGSVQGYFQINQIEAETVKNIYHWSGEEKISIRKIIKRLQNLEIKPRKSKRGVWNTSTVGRMLRNSTYIGTSYYNRSYAVVPENPLKELKYKKVKKTSRKIRPRDEWIDIPGITPIISKRLFNKVQKQLKVNFERSSRNRKNDYMLSGVIRCVCDKTRAGEGPQKGRHLYYRCTDRVTRYPLKRECYEKGINARIADDLVWKQLTKLMSSPDLIEKQINRYLSKNKKTTTNTTKSLEVLKSELRKLIEEEKRYIKAFGTGIIVQSQLEEAVRDLEIKKKSIQGQIKRIASENEENSVVLPSKQLIKDFCSNYDNIMLKLPFQTRRKVSLELIDKVIANQKKLEVFGYLPMGKEVVLYAERRNCWSAKCG